MKQLGYLGIFIVAILLVVFTLNLIPQASNIANATLGKNIHRGMNVLLTDYVNHRTAVLSDLVEIDKFFGYDNIDPNMITDMNPKNYFVFYHRNGSTEKELIMADILMYYKSLPDSFNVYLLDLDKYDDQYSQIRLEFFVTDTDGTRIMKDFWFHYSELSELPFNN